MSAYGLNRAKGTQAPVKSTGSVRSGGSNGPLGTAKGKGNAPASRYSRSSANVGGRKK